MTKVQLNHNLHLCYVYCVQCTYIYLVTKRCQQRTGHRQFNYKVNKVTLLPGVVITWWVVLSTPVRNCTIIQVSCGIMVSATNISYTGNIQYTYLSHTKYILYIDWFWKWYIASASDDITQTWITVTKMCLTGEACSIRNFVCSAIFQTDMR